MTPTDLTTRYRRSVASRYRALRPDELHEVPPGPAWVSPKLDGELWFAVLEPGSASLVTTHGRTLEGAPMLAELQAASARVTGRTILAGELFAAGSKGSRPRVGDVGAALASQALERLGWHGFDVLELDGAPAPATYAERLEALERILAGGKRTAAIKTVTANNPAEIAARWQEWGESGKAEGLVVRAHDGRIFKVKPSFHIDAAVVGFTPRADAPDELRSVLVALVRPDGTFNLLCSVGNLGSVDDRRALLRSLAPRETSSRFRHTSGDGSLVHWVRPEVVIEVACTDLQADDSEGAPVTRWALSHDASGWAPIGPMPCVSVIHPVLARVRTDKVVDKVDVRFSQVGERCLVSALDAPAEAVERPLSAMTRREAFTKVTKGKTAVRKLVVWQTHKEALGWPAWVVHLTDYSPDRKTPLERIVRTAISAEEANALADALLAEHIKKGWEPTPQTSAQDRATAAPRTPPTKKGDRPSSPPDEGAADKPKRPRKKPASD
jgi:hypothetical protein